MMSNNPIWDYSVATYSLQGVAPACLALQETFGLDVNLLLEENCWRSASSVCRYRSLIALPHRGLAA